MYKELRDYQVLLQRIQQADYCVAALIDIDHFVKSFPEANYSETIRYIDDYFKKKHAHEILYLGKDEFALIAYDPKVNISTFILELNHSNQQLEKTLHTTFSAAIAEFPSYADDPIEFVRGLEESLHYSKQISRNRISLANESKMKMKSNYYTIPQLERLSRLSKQLNRSEASLLREALDLVLRRYEG